MGGKWRAEMEKGIGRKGLEIREGWGSQRRKLEETGYVNCLA